MCENTVTKWRNTCPTENLSVDRLDVGQARFVFKVRKSARADVVEFLLSLLLDTGMLCHKQDKEMQERSSGSCPSTDHRAAEVRGCDVTVMLIKR